MKKKWRLILLAVVLSVCLVAYPALIQKHPLDEWCGDCRGYMNEYCVGEVCMWKYQNESLLIKLKTLKEVDKDKAERMASEGL
ncbi:MAG: hypothetical protein KKD39_06410, partial [Candidatus Altiarchaeota archaeon]|nr:hypothetical protein [Candidatus Altiarchaeota archaeon]